MNCLDFMSSERQTSGVEVRAALPRPGRVLQLIHINLRDPLLSTTNKDSMRESIQSLYHDLITGSKDLPLIPFKGTFCSCQTATPFIDMEQEQGENTTLSPLMKAASYMMVPTACGVCFYSNHTDSSSS